MPTHDQSQHRVRARKRDSMVSLTALSSGSINTSTELKRKYSYREPNEDNKRKERLFIERKNIQCRRCTRFVQTANKGSQEKPICGCGYPKSDHLPSCFSSIEPPAARAWGQKNDTEPLPTDSHGEILFVEHGQRSARYIRVDVNTDADVMWQLLTRVWKLTPPNLIISVTGGAKDFHMTQRLKNVFRKGLIKAALSTEAWITSSGTHAGVMKYVGEAVRDLVMGQTSQNRVVALGIAPWGCVQNKQVLIQTGGTADYRVEAKHVSGETPLDCNHSHFILVDDGTQHKFAVEIPFRAKLEKAISVKSRSRTADKVKIPIILVVVEGGPGTLQTVYNSIQERTPAVILAGSGRAANILAYAVHNSCEQVIEESRRGGEKIRSKALVMSSAVEAEVRGMLAEVFREQNEKKLSEWTTWIRHCLLCPDLLSVYQLETSRSPTDIDIVMLQALLKANNEQVLEQLKLALIWDRADIAKSHIFTEDRPFKTGSLDDIMFSALLLNRVDFVKLLLENGVCLRDFLTVQRLQALYQSAPRKSILSDLLKKFRKYQQEDTVTLHQVGHLIRFLVGDFYNPLYLRMSPKHVEDEVDLVPVEFDRAERGLFVWCILTNRCDMALVFWDEGRDSMAAALVANSLLKAMRQRAGDNDLKQQLHRDAIEFESLAIGILRESYGDDESRALELLVRPLLYWGKTNCVSIAIESNNKDFIAQPACQELFNAVWWGDMETSNGLHILPCVVFPPLVLVCIRFRRDLAGTQNNVSDDQSHWNRKSVFRNSGSWENQRASTWSKSSSFSHPRPSAIIRQPISQKFKQYFQAPVTKFCYTVMSFLGFLLLYSYVMLIDFRSNVSVPEIVLITWVFTMAVEEVRQLWKSSPGPAWVRALNYVADKWNILDVVTIGLFVLGMSLRAVPHTDAFTAARIVLAINLFTFFMRLLHIFSVSKIMGPKLVMIGRMLTDLMTFMLIMLVFIVGYGVTSQSILYPNTDLNNMLVIDVLKKAYWQMFAELYIEEIEGKEDCVPDMAAYTNGTHVRCPSEVGTVLVPILLGFYMLLMHVLLLSLLIAVFTNTFEAIQANTDLHWHFQRYKLVYEYYERPTLPPPFILLSHIYRVMQFCGAGFKTNVMYGFLSECSNVASSDDKSLELFEENKRDEFMWRRRERRMKTTDQRVARTTESVDGLVTKVDDIHDHMSLLEQVEAEKSSAQSKVINEVTDNLSSLQLQVKQLQTSLDWLIQSLNETGKITETMELTRLQPAIRIDGEPARAEDQEPPEVWRTSLLRQTTSVETRQLGTIKSRSSPYPESNIDRSDIPEDKTAWEDDLPQYSPAWYTSDRVQENPLWADVDIDGSNVFTWNGCDSELGVNRVSYQGEYTIDSQGYPLNPIGRTGLCGRGCLGRWGPNHAADPIVTRWKLDENGDVVEREGKPVLEFVAVRRHDNKHWALPGGFLQAGEDVHDAVKRRFGEEAMASLNQQDEGDVQRLDELLSHGTEIYRGYVDDERNTDNAWIETVAMNYHDEDGAFTRDLKLRAGKTEDAVAWLPVWSNIPMQANHCFILERVSEMRDAAL